MPASGSSDELAWACANAHRAPRCLPCHHCATSHTGHSGLETFLPFTIMSRTCQRLMVAPIMPTNSFSTDRRRSASVSFLTLGKNDDAWATMHLLAFWPASATPVRLSYPIPL